MAVDFEELADALSQEDKAQKLAKLSYRERRALAEEAAAEAWFEQAEDEITNLMDKLSS